MYCRFLPIASSFNLQLLACALICVQWQSVAAVRKHLLAHFSSLSDMKAVADTALAEHNRKVAEENARLAKKHAEQQAKMAQRRAAQLAANQAMRVSVTDCYSTAVWAPRCQEYMSCCFVGPASSTLHGL